MLYATFDGNLLLTFKVIVNKTIGLLFVAMVYNVCVCVCVCACVC